MISATWITLAVVTILGLTKLLTWYLGKPRRIQKLQEKERAILEDLRSAVASLNTMRISMLERELKLVREDLARLNAK